MNSLDHSIVSVVRHGPLGSRQPEELGSEWRAPTAALQDWHRYWLQRHAAPSDLRMELRIQRKLSGPQLANMVWMILLCGSIALIAWALRSYLVAWAMTLIGLVASGVQAWWTLRDYQRAQRMPRCLLSVAVNGDCRLYDGTIELPADQVLHLEYQRRRTGHSGGGRSINRLSLWARCEDGLHEFELAAGRHDYRQHIQRLGIRLAAHTDLRLLDDPAEHRRALAQALKAANT